MSMDHPQHLQQQQSFKGNNDERYTAMNANKNMNYDQYNSNSDTYDDGKK